MKKDQIIWGASGLSHDAAIAVIKNGNILFAASSERYSRIKNDPEFHSALILDCLQFGAPDVIVWYEKPFKKFLRRLLIDKKWAPYSVKNTFEQYGIKAPIKYVDHHVSHLCGSLYTAPWKDLTNTLGIVVDSVGEFKTLSVWDIKDENNYKCIYSQYYPNSLGLFYSSITDMLGLKPQEEEYIMMGMASYGNSSESEGMSYYNYFIENLFDNKGNLKVDLRRGCRGLMSELMEEGGGSCNLFDVAWAAQKVYETMVLHITKKYLNITGYKKLVMSGGCALNCTANTHIHRLVDDMWIFPNPGDAGSSLGAALAYYGKPVKLENMCLGSDANSNIDINDLVNYLNINKMAGVIYGKAEFGPRAFGHRSILADPRVPDIKDIVNEVKGREKFRPFAPIVLQEHFNEIFEGVNSNTYYPYMQFTFTCKKPDLYPGIVHVDGTSRVQTVNSDQPFVYEVLKKWYALTGCPVLLNTSLNIKGKPLLNKIDDKWEFNHKPLKIYG